MAHFRGTVQGGRSEASRLGHKTTGLTVNACSWNGAIEVTLRATPEGDVAEIWQKTHHGKGLSEKIADVVLGKSVAEGV